MCLDDPHLLPCHTVTLARYIMDRNKTSQNTAGGQTVSNTLPRGDDRLPGTLTTPGVHQALVLSCLKTSFAVF